VEAFFDALGEKRAKRLKLVSCDMAGWIEAVLAKRRPKAKRCVDPFHVVQLATEALDKVRREVWREARYRVEGVGVENARSGGLVVEMGSRRVTVRDFSASNSQFDGLAGYDTEDSLFTGLDLHDNLAAGLSFDNDFDHNPGSGDSAAPANEGFGMKVVDASCTDNLVVASQFAGNRDGDVFEAASGLLTKEASITR
jgi:hypothetical protein